MRSINYGYTNFALSRINMRAGEQTVFDRDIEQGSMGYYFTEGELEIVKASNTSVMGLIISCEFDDETKLNKQYYTLNGVKKEYDRIIPELVNSNSDNTFLAKKTTEFFCVAQENPNKDLYDISFKYVDGLWELPKDTGFIVVHGGIEAETFKLSKSNYFKPRENSVNIIGDKATIILVPKETITRSEHKKLLNLI